MPNEYSNFTTPDVGTSSGGYKAPQTPNEYGNVWDPATQTWVPAAQAPTSGNATKPTFNWDPRRWGGQGESRTEDGTIIEGTSGAERDIARARALAESTQRDAPVVDQSRSNESRGYQAGALNLIGDVARGGYTRVDTLGRELSNDANSATRSLAASVRGGASARAAAARGASAAIGTNTARANQAIAAQHAAGMADARGSYAAGANALRGEDLRLATDQAGLVVGERKANQANEQFYEGLAGEVAKADLDGMMGKSSSEIEASLQAGRNATRSDAAARAETANDVNAVVGGLNGIAGGASRANGAGTPKSAPDDPNRRDIETSDARAKQDVRPIMLSDVTSKEPTGAMPLYAPDGAELHMSDAGRGYLASAAPDAVSGASLSGPTPRYGSAPKQAEAPKAKAKTAPKARKFTDAELEKIGREMQGYVGEQSKAGLGAGPSINPMADANRSMVPSSYAYKPGHAEEAGQQPGERNVGPMAQNMAADPVASTAIAKRPDGMLAIDKDKALKLTMGGLSSLQQQVDQLEAERKRASA